MNRLTWMQMILGFPMAFAPEDGTGTPPADPPANAGAGDPPADPAAGAGDPPATPPAGQAQNWWESSDLDADTQQWLTAKGYAQADKDAVLLKAVKGHREAEKRLGNKPEDLLTRPKDGQAVSEWLAAQREKLGLPDAEDGYKVEPPEGWPKDAKWNEGMEAKARKLAFEAGVPPEVHQKYVELYATEVQQMLADAETELTGATQKMLADLQKDWGDQTQAKITVAKQAAQVMAERVGMDSQALSNLVATMSDKTGDANVMRFFAAIGDMMGDDVAVSMGRNAGSIAMTPQEADAEIAKISAPGGEYYEAFKGSDHGAKERARAKMQTLTKIAAQANKR